MTARKLLSDLAAQAGWVMRDIDEKARTAPKKSGSVFLIDEKRATKPLAAAAKNRIMESMTRVETTNYVVRVWRNEPDLLPKANDDIVRALAGLEERRDIIEALEALPEVVAIEVLDRQGNGVLLYPDWN